MFSTIFVVDTKMIFRHDFVALLIKESKPVETTD